MTIIASAVAASVALLGLGAGASHAATVPKGTPSKAVVVERNENDKVTNYKLKDADPMTGRFGYPPYGHGAHHTTAHVHLAVNDPTTNLIRY